MKKKLRIALTFIGLLVTWCAMVWLCMAFYSLSLNPHEWSQDIRFIFILFGPACGIFIAGVISAATENEPG